METKCVSILLTKLNGRFGDFIYWAAGRRYTHASIRLDDMGEVYYSFHFKGLCEEQPGFFSPKRVARSVLYQIELPLPIYEKLEARLREFLQARECYRYSWLGLCLCLLGVPHRFPGAFFCSQFVAELLTRSEVIRLEESTSLCTPNRLERAICQSGLLRKVTPDPLMA